MTASNYHLLVVWWRDEEEEQHDHSSGGEDQSDHCHHEAAGAKVRYTACKGTAHTNQNRKITLSHVSPQSFLQSKPGSLLFCSNLWPAVFLWFTKRTSSRPFLTALTVTLNQNYRRNHKKVLVLSPKLPNIMLSLKKILFFSRLRDL